MLSSAEAGLRFQIDQVNVINLREDVLRFEMRTLKGHSTEVPCRRQADSSRA
jgi:hypothetical protein